MVDGSPPNPETRLDTYEMSRLRTGYQRYAGERGFTPEQFRATAEEVVGADLEDWFRRAVKSTEELDYADALDWFGLCFAPPAEAVKKEVSDQKEAATKKEPARKWKLEVRADATEAQHERLKRLLGPDKKALEFGTR